MSRVFSFLGACVGRLAALVIGWLTPSLGAAFVTLEALLGEVAVGGRVQVERQIVNPSGQPVTHALAARIDGRLSQGDQVSRRSQQTAR